ncbi:hypothetical protein GCM10027169_00290 [Gordonia jinhuaensis]|uniref:MobA/VirD2-like nuclease domain-containing protein n=1 Tax=Gordonia jinhuaensis TaxID=1517702 RepID=A0A916WPJ6_9ACTN|nr:hypothetical protein [Gordonia jinhuaensis]GGB18293.1 hypothetical protein GCM10011489_02950 [Gordonia jinhuaensis]
MTTLVGSAVDDPVSLDGYMGTAPAHDQDNPRGPSQRAEYVSTVGDCTPETFVPDMRRTALAFGQTSLVREAYSYVLSHSHEELDPTNDFHGWLAHQLAREWVARTFPGRQAKLVTQRDNGRWEGEGDDRRWVEGHWHTHVMVANVAEQEVTLRWTSADGDELVKHYKAGRAIDGDIKNIYRLQGMVDEVVLEQWRYDNAAYVDSCRRFSEGQVAKADLAQRAARGYSNHDQVRLKLREALAQSDGWSDYVTRCQAMAVDVQVHGQSGVSYAWVGDDGLERKARARGKTGIGPEFTKAEVEARCEANAAALERGETLDVPEPVLVPLTPTVAPDRPRPQYLTVDGKPPWDDEQAQAAYTEAVQATGGTYEGRAARALATGEQVPGVELVRGADGRASARVDVGEGPLAVDVDAGLVERVQRIESLEADARTEAGQIVSAAQTQAGTITEQAQVEAREIKADADAAARQTTAEAKRVAHEVVEDAKGDRDEIRRKANADWAEAKQVHEDAVTDRKAAAAEKAEAAKANREAQERRDAIPVYDPEAAERFSSAELMRNLKVVPHGREALTAAHKMGLQNHKGRQRVGDPVSEKTFMTETSEERGVRMRGRSDALATEIEQNGQRRSQQAGRRMKGSK